MPTVPSENTALLSGAGTEDARQTISRHAYEANARYGAACDGEAEVGSSDIEDSTTWTKEALFLCRYAAPLIVTYGLQYTYNLMIVYMSGQIGANELAAASIATMTANITGMVVYEALATCLDTLTSQAYGSGNKEMVGLHVQRMALLALFATVPIGAIWFTSPYYLERLIPEKEIARLAGRFLRVYVIGAPGYGIFEAAKRFTQAQGDFLTSLAVLIVCAPLNLLWNWLFVTHLDLGFEGAALAAATSFNLQPVVFLLYIYFFRKSTWDCWPGIIWSRIFHNWGPMLRLAGPSLVMCLSEWLSFEVLTFACSYLGPKPLAAQSVLMTVGVAMYHIPFPASVAASTRFGNLIGHGSLKAARTAFNLHYTVFVGIGIFDIALLVSLRHVIASVFTDDVEVRAIIATMMPLLALLQFLDATTAISNGLLRGLGKQAVGGVLNAAAYYVVGIPLAMLLAFGPSKLGLVGLWIGPIAGLLVATLTMFTYMRLTNWEKAAEEARARQE